MRAPIVPLFVTAIAVVAVVLLANAMNWHEQGSEVEHVRAENAKALSESANIRPALEGEELSDDSFVRLNQVERGVMRWSSGWQDEIDVFKLQIIVQNLGRNKQDFNDSRSAYVLPDIRNGTLGQSPIPDDLQIIQVAGDPVLLEFDRVLQEIVRPVAIEFTVEQRMSMGVPYEARLVLGDDGIESLRTGYNPSAKFQDVEVVDRVRVVIESAHFKVQQLSDEWQEYQAHNPIVWLWRLEALRPGQSAFVVKVQRQVMTRGTERLVTVRAFTQVAVVEIDWWARTTFLLSSIPPAIQGVAAAVTALGAFGGLWAWLRKKRRRKRKAAKSSHPPGSEQSPAVEPSPSPV